MQLLALLTFHNLSPSVIRIAASESRSFRPSAVTVDTPSCKSATRMHPHPNKALASRQSNDSRFNIPTGIKQLRHRLGPSRWMRKNRDPCLNCSWTCRKTTTASPRSSSSSTSARTSQEDWARRQCPPLPRRFRALLPTSHSIRPRPFLAVSLSPPQTMTTPTLARSTRRPAPRRRVLQVQRTHPSSRTIGVSPWRWGSSTSRLRRPRLRRAPAPCRGGDTAQIRASQPFIKASAASSAAGPRTSRSLATRGCGAGTPVPSAAARQRRACRCCPLRRRR